jgi:uncharacterized protein YkwD
MPPGAPARHRGPRRRATPANPPASPRISASASRAWHPPSRAPRRLWWLLPGLLVLPLLAAGGIYLTRGSTPAPAPAPATDRVTARQTPSACDPATAAAADSCAGRPFNAAVATVPTSLPPSPRTRAKHPGARRSSPPASASPSRAASSPTAPAAGSPGTSPGSPAAQVLALINQARSAAGLAPLTITAGLNTSASRHNATMAGGCGLSHQCSGEPDLGARETAAGVTWTTCGENIGEGGPVANSSAAIAQMAVGLTQSMLNEKPPDDGHRRNILSRSFAHIGIAVYRDPSGTVWLTQDFSN